MPGSDDLVYLFLNGHRYVYLTEDSVARVIDLVEFVRQHEAEFLRWRQQWGEAQFPTVVPQ